MPLTLLIDHLPTQRMFIQPVSRQYQRQLFVLSGQLNGGQQIVAPPAGKQDSQSQQTTQMLSHPRWDGILLMKRREVDSVSLVKEQRGNQLLLRRGKARQVEVIDQIGGVLRRALKSTLSPISCSAQALRSKSRLSGSSSQLPSN